MMKHAVIALLLALGITLGWQPRVAQAQPVRAGAPPAGTLIVHPADGALMAWVPAGTFRMGFDVEEAQRLAAAWGYESYHQFAGEEWFPARQVWLPGYFIDVHEVTTARWEQFVALSQHQSPLSVRKYAAPPADEPRAYALYPVTRVLWAEAQLYANWMGKALPTEEQWEKAARGTDGRWFPWGNELPAVGLGAFSAEIMPDKPTHAYPVGTYPQGASPYGCLDLAGNVYEWTSAWFEPYPNNPERQRLLSYTGHTNGVLRGGSFYHRKFAFCAAKRFGLPPAETHFHIGFRTVWEPPADYFQSPAFTEAQAKVPAAQAALEALRQLTREMPRNF